MSERRLGSFLAAGPRDEFTVCTKVGRRLLDDSAAASLFPLCQRRGVAV